MGILGYGTPSITQHELDESLKKHPWKKALEPPEDELDFVIAPSNIEGKIPEAIEGTVFGNGAGRLRYGNQVSELRHWKYISPHSPPFPPFSVAIGLRPLV